jgi:hypothetical protein
MTCTYRKASPTSVCQLSPPLPEAQLILHKSQQSPPNIVPHFTLVVRFNWPRALSIRISSMKPLSTQVFKMNELPEWIFFIRVMNFEMYFVACALHLY